ncbi:MAG: hypothetical protein AAGF12_19490 [Myxococcota bacterium]
MKVTPAVVLFLTLSFVGTFGLTGPAAAQFDVDIDAFGFQNYTNENNPINLTSAELHRFFGDRVCATGSGPNCTLTPQAEQWMEQTSKAMNGGHCEGMAVLALRFFLEQDDPTNYGAETVVELPLAGNDALTREIGYWWATQALAPVNMSETRGTPAEVIDLLDAFLDGGPTAYTVGIYKRDWTGGHAVTPFDVVDVEPDVVDILVYDNNFPGEERAIRVDLAANTWSYSAAASPDIPESTYEGDAMTGTLGLTPMPIREGMLECPFCGSYRAGMGARRTIRVTGEAAVLIQNEAGEELGHRPDGTFVNTIAGASFAPTKSDDLWNDQSEPTYLVPSGSELQVVISDQGEGTDASDFAVIGEGYYLGIENVVLDPGQADMAYVGRDIASIGYETSAMETADVVIATETDTADWLIVVRTRGDAGGQRIDAGVDFSDGGGLTFRFGGQDAESELDLYISRIDDRGEFEFGNDGLSVPNNVDLFLRFADFDQDGEALDLQIDADGDGTFEQMQSLSDEGGFTDTTPPVTPDGGMTPDGGVSPDGGMGSGGGGDDGGCSAGGGRGSWPSAALVALVFLALRRRR